MRTNPPTRSPRPPADKVLLALACMAEYSSVTASEAEIAVQARIPEAEVLPALKELERCGDLESLRARRGGTWLITLAFNPDAPGNTLTVPWDDPIVPPRGRVVLPMPPDLPLPFYCGNRKVARSYLKIIGGLQSLVIDGLACATLAEICKVSGMRDVNTVKYHLGRLETEGVVGVYYGREFGRSRRAFEILKPVDVPAAIWPGHLPSPELPDMPILEPMPEPMPDVVARVMVTASPMKGVGQLLFAWADGTV